MADGLCLEISEQKNLEWVEKLSKVKDNITALDDVMSYVKKLNSWMKLKETAAILKQLPSIGKLLSNLSKICNLSQDGLLSEVVLESIVHLSKLPNSLHHSSSNAKKKATEWAINQLQFITLPAISEEDACFYDQFEITPEEISIAQIKEVTSLCSITTQDSCYDGSCYGFDKMQSKSKLLHEISQHLVPMVHKSEWKPLIETLLLSQEKPIGHLNCETGEMEDTLCKEFLNAVTKNEDLFDKLSYRSTVCLWRCHMPAFEIQVLNLIEVVLKRAYINDSGILLVVNSHQKLVRACANYEIFYEHAFDILWQTLSNVGGLPCLMSLINILYVSIRMTNHQNISSRMRNSSLKIIQSLPLDPSALPLKDKEKVVDLLAQELRMLFTSEGQQSQHVDKSSLWFELLKHKHWMDVSKLLIFNGSNSCIDSCLTVLSLFYLLTLDSDVLKTFKSFMINLRCLTSKNLLQMADMRCIITSCEQAQGNQNTAPLSRDLMLMFLAVANGSHFVLRETFSMVTEGMSYECKLDLWLRTLETTFSRQPSNSSNSQKIFISTDKKESMLLFLSCLSERTFAKLSETSEKDGFENTSEISTPQNDLQNRTLTCISRLKEI